MFICPKHRNTFEINWSNRGNVGHHPDHDTNQHLRAKGCRVAMYYFPQRLANFLLVKGDDVV